MPADFGWSYPAGVSPQDIDDAVGADEPVLYKADREKAKALATAPETKMYIEYLEGIAKAAVELWKNVGAPCEREYADNLFEVLETLDFMEDE